MNRNSKFFGLTISDEIAQHIIEIFEFTNIKCNTLKDCETVFLLKFDIYNDQDESFQDLFIKCRDIIILHETYTIDEFIFFIYKFIYPYLLVQTRNSIYQNNPLSTFDPINNQILEESENEAKNDLKILFFQLTNFISPDIFKELDSHYNDKQKKFALNGTLEFLKTFVEFEHYNDFDKAINTLGNLSKNKEKKLFKYLADANLNYISAENEIFYIDIVNIVLSVAKIYQILDQYETKINALKDIIEELSNSLDTVILSNLLINLTLFKQKVNKNQVLQYVALYYYHNIIQNKEVPFDVLKEIFAILFKKQKNKLFTDKELIINEIEKPFTFLHYPASTYCPDINAFPNKNIHQLCKDKSKAMEFYYLDDNKN